MSIEELAVHFTLSADELISAHTRRSERSRLGFAVLACCHRYLGYPPQDATDVPGDIVAFVARQLKVPASLFAEYGWRSRAWMYHLEECRKLRQWRPCKSADQEGLVAALFERGGDLVTRKQFLAEAVIECRRQALELPSEDWLRRIANSARRRFMDDTYAKLSSRLSADARRWIEESLEANPARGMTTYEWLRSRPGKLGVKTLLGEVDKLTHLREFGLDEVHLGDVSEAVLDAIASRALSENTERMKRHPIAVRDGLLVGLCWKLRQRITDRLVRTFMDLVHRCDKKADKAVKNDIVREPRKAFNARLWLRKVAQAYFAHPQGTFEEDLLPVVPEEVLREAVIGQGGQATYDQARNETARQKYCHHYRRMVRPVLDALVFHAEGEACQSVVDAVQLVREHFDSRATHYPEDVEVPESLIGERWKEAVFVEHRGKTRIHRHFCELAVLENLRESVKCKDAWVEGAYKYRDPSRDLPQDWDTAREQHYAGLALPMSDSQFVTPIRDQMATALQEFNVFLTRGADVRVSFPGGGSKGAFLVPRVRKRPERPLLRDIRASVLERWGIVELLDMLVEADRQVDLAQFFDPITEHQILSSDEVRERLMAVLFGLGTNLGLKRVHVAAKPRCSYESLLYFRSRYVTEAALREANAALVNHILALRDPAIWGRGTTCASDGKYLGAWEQNLVAERNPHYGKPGIMAYWHVDDNATCIHAMHHRIGASQVAPMLEGLVRHDTEMRVESNFVDSHGQSEVAFAFTRMLGIELLPRLKRIKREKVYQAHKGMRRELPNLSGVLARVIRWNLIEQQYDDMVRHVVALAEGTGPVDSILQRFNRYNPGHPTYKAFLELGKAQKTIFLCRYLSDPKLRRQINAALNIVESWNAVIDFIFFGRRSELQSNDEDVQRQSILALQLLQNAVILANTVMVERVLALTTIGTRMQAEDYRSLTPLFTQNINPYGQFTINFERPSFLEAS